MVQTFRAVQKLSEKKIESIRKINSYVYLYLLKQALSACVATVKSRPILSPYSIVHLSFSHNFPYLRVRTTSWDIVIFDTCKITCDVTLYGKVYRSIFRTKLLQRKLKLYFFKIVIWRPCEKKSDTDVVSWQEKESDTRCLVQKVSFSPPKTR